MDVPSQTPRPSLRRVDEVCEDEASRLALLVVRYVASGYMTGDVACWDAAFDRAERSIGAADGRRLVAGTIGMMRALRAERRQEWTFMPATCCRLTEGECALVALVAQARRRGAGARGAADFAGRGAASELAAALADMAAAVNGAADRLATGAARISATAALHRARRER